jgi:hypothetical protein
MVDAQDSQASKYSTNIGHDDKYYHEEVHSEEDGEAFKMLKVMALMMVPR